MQMKDDKRQKKPLTPHDLLLAAALDKMKALHPELAENTRKRKTGFGAFKNYLINQEYHFDL
jgi:hypothetical protein